MLMPTKAGQAIYDFTKSIEINKGNANVYYNRGTAYSQKGEFDKAIDDFNNVIELNPKDPKAYLNKAIILDNSGDKANAIEAYRYFIKYGRPEHKKRIDLARDRIKFLEKDLRAPH